MNLSGRSIELHLNFLYIFYFSRIQRRQRITWNISHSVIDWPNAVNIIEFNQHVLCWYFSIRFRVISWIFISPHAWSDEWRDRGTAHVFVCVCDFLLYLLIVTPYAESCSCAISKLSLCSGDNLNYQQAAASVSLGSAFILEEKSRQRWNWKNLDCWTLKLVYQQQNWWKRDIIITIEIITFDRCVRAVIARFHFTRKFAVYYCRFRSMRNNIVGCNSLNLRS